MQKIKLIDPKGIIIKELSVSSRSHYYRIRKKWVHTYGKKIKDIIIKN